MFHNFINRFEIRRVSNAVAAGTTDINSSAVDMRGFESVAFVVALGTLTATQVTSIKVQQSDDSGSSDSWDDLAGTASPAAADGDSNKLIGVEVYRPKKRYVRLVVDRGTANAVVDGIFAVLGRPDVSPVAYSAFTATPEIHNSPAEGTA